MVTYFNKIMILVDNCKVIAFSPHYLSSFSCFYNIFKYLPTKQKNLILIFFLILEVMHVTFKNVFLTCIISFINKYALIFVV